LALQDRYEQFDNPKVPEGLPKTPGDWVKTKPLASPKGPEGKRAALALLKGSALEQQNPKAAEALAVLVEKGALGVHGLDRLLRQSEENQVNASKLAALLGALGQLEKSSTTAQELALAFRPDSALTKALLADGLSPSLVEKIEAAVAKAALEPGAVDKAKRGWGDFGAGRAKDLVAYFEARQGLKEGGAGGAPLANLDPLDALALQAQTLKTLAAAAQKIEAEIRAADKLGGDAGADARQKALRELGKVSAALSEAIAQDTGLDRKLLEGNGPEPGKTPPPSGGGSGTAPAPAPAPAPAQAGAGSGNAALLQEIRDQLADLKQEQHLVAKEEQHLRAQDLYNGTAFIDRNGYQVQEATAILRPNADSVQEVTTSQRSAGPDAGTSVFAVQYTYNQALPLDWTGIVGRSLNDPANLVNGAPNYYLTQEQLSLRSPTGCELCIDKFETPLTNAQGQVINADPAPVALGNGLFGVPYTLAFTAGGVLLGGAEFSYSAAGVAVANPVNNMDILLTTAKAQADNSWLVTYYNSSSNGVGLPVLTELFTAQVWLLDPAGLVQPSSSISSDLSGGLGTLSLLSPGLMNEMLVSPSTGGSVDVLVPNAGFVGAFQGFNLGAPQ
jgi:hypothetical protein